MSIFVAGQLETRSWWFISANKLIARFQLCKYNYIYIYVFVCIPGGLLTLDACAHRGLKYLVCKRVSLCVCLLPCFLSLWVMRNWSRDTNRLFAVTTSRRFHKNAPFNSYGVKTKRTSWVCKLILAYWDQAVEASEVTMQGEYWNTQCLKPCLLCVTSQSQTLWARSRLHHENLN